MQRFWTFLGQGVYWWPHCSWFCHGPCRIVHGGDLPLQMITDSLPLPPLLPCFWDVPYDVVIANSAIVRKSEELKLFECVFVMSLCDLCNIFMCYFVEAIGFEIILAERQVEPPLWLEATYDVYALRHQILVVLRRKLLHLWDIRLIEGSLEVKLPTIWTWKNRGGKSQRRGEKKREDQRRERVRRKKMQVGEKVQKSRFTVFLQWFVASEGRKVGSLAKAAGAATSGQMRDEKLQAAVARSTLRSQNAQNTAASEHFLKLRCRKSARRCGAKQISKSKCEKQWKTHVWNCLDHFWTFGCRFAWQAQGIVHLVKGEQDVRVL